MLMGANNINKALKDLPPYIIRKGKSKYFLNTITGKLIHEDNIYKFTKSYYDAKQERIIKSRWDLNY